VAADIDVECDGLIASRLTPTGFVAITGICGPHKSTVGAELARDGGVSVTIDAGCDGLIASKLGSYKVLR